MSDASTLELTKPKLTRGNGTTGKKHTQDYSKRRTANQFTKDPGPYSRVHRLAKLDWRSSEGQIVNRLRRELIKHVGGNPSVVQRVVIERCCFLQLRLCLLDKKMAEGHSFTEIDSHSYIAFSNALVRTMTRLGINPKPNGGSRTSVDHILAELDDAAR